MNQNGNGEYDRHYTNRVMALLAFIVVIVMYVEGMLTPSLRSIASGFGVSASQVSLVLSSYLVGGVALTPVVGKLGDIYGKKKMLSISLVVYAIFVSVTGFSPNFTFMVISRTIQGIGLTILPLGMSLIREEFPKEMVPKAQALISAMFGAGFAVSLPLGSLVSNDFGWRWTYHSAVPFVIMATIVALIVIKESRYKRPEVKIDYVGATVLAIVLGLFVFGLSQGPVWGWSSFNVVTMFVLATVLIVPLVLYEFRYTKNGGEAILNFRLLSQRNVMVTNLAIAISGMGMFLAMQALTYRFELPVPDGLGKSILATGISMVPFAVGMIVFAPITGQLISRVGVKPFAVLGSVIAGIGFLLQALIPSYTMVMVYEFVTGAGLSMLNASVINYLILTVDPRDMGLATGMNGTFRNVGSAIGAPTAGSLLSTFTAVYTIGNVGGHPITAVLPSHLAFYYAFIIAAATFAAGIVTIYFGEEVLGKRSPKETERRKFEAEFQTK
ncbi:MAG: MFS transporter [Candidatus Thermoplasmatota archaeon]|jgi:MFS family permease|nr:MFS transporter [Candidatus Thermoplasmatota archaeon]MCL6002693.1 MFS transporter [Candidatus Thermoplasmatota archaeon]